MQPPPEQPADAELIRHLTNAAFALAEHSSGIDNHPDLRYAGPPPQYFMALPNLGPLPTGIVTYREAFSA